MENTNPNIILNACSLVIDSFYQQNEYVIAFSGGEDSSVLLHAMVQLMQDKNIKLRTIHINHNLQDNAHEVSAHCSQISEDYGIKHSSYDVEIDPSSNIEEKCRVQRYNILQKHSHRNELILIGHHLNDQIETFFLRMLRGSALKGLSSMHPSTTLNDRTIIRPLLGISKSEIQTYRQKNKITFIEDASNTDTRFDRNFIRRNIIPELKKRWTSLEKIMSNNLSILELQSHAVDTFIDSYYDVCISADDTSLFIDEVKNLKFDIQVLLIHQWVHRVSSTILNLRHIHEILKIMDTNNDSNPLFVFDNAKITKNGNKLIINKP